MPPNRARNSDRHQDRSRQFSAPASLLWPHRLPDLPHQSHVVRAGSLGARNDLPGAKERRGFAGLIVDTASFAMEGDLEADPDPHRNIDLAAASQGLSDPGTTIEAGPGAQRAAPSGGGAAADRKARG